MWTITRQLQWSTGLHIVEISEGSIDYTNPDALSPLYPGEFGEYEDPREAVRVAIEIRDKWQKDEPDKNILIGHGATGGYTLPFESTDNIKELKIWAKGVHKELPKCAHCNGVMPHNTNEWYFHDLTDDHYCSDICVERDFYRSEEETETDTRG